MAVLTVRVRKTLADTADAYTCDRCAIILLLHAVESILKS